MVSISRVRLILFGKFVDRTERFVACPFVFVSTPAIVNEEERSPRRTKRHMEEENIGLRRPAGARHSSNSLRILSVSTAPGAH